MVKRKILFSAAGLMATSLSLNQPAHLLILFNKIFGVSVLSGLGQSCHSPKMQKVNSNSEIILTAKHFKPYGEPAGQSGWYYGEDSLPALLPFFLPHAFSAPGHRQKPPASISRADKT